jgi:hypothetical protein
MINTRVQHYAPTGLKTVGAHMRWPENITSAENEFEHNLNPKPVS